MPVDVLVRKLLYLRRLLAERDFSQFVAHFETDLDQADIVDK